MAAPDRTMQGWAVRLPEVKREGPGSDIGFKIGQEIMGAGLVATYEAMTVEISR